MAALANSRNVLLNTGTRIADNSKSIGLVADKLAFTFDSTGTLSPAGQYITFTATPVRTTNAITWSTVPAGLSLYTSPAATTLATNETTVYLFGTTFAANPAVEVIATITDGTVIRSSLNVLKQQAGAAGTNGTNGTSGISAVLTNDSFSIPTTSTGTSPVFTGSGTDIYVYEGATQLVYDGSGTTNGTWTVSKADTFVTSGSFTDQGNFARLSDLTAIAADTGLVTFTITGKSSAGTSFTLTKVQTFNKSKAGVVGSSPLIYDLVLSSPVITKAAPDAATAGAHTAITIQGKKYDGSTTTNFGWITITPNNTGVEGARTNTASVTITLNPATTAATDGYTIRMYDDPTAGNLVDTQTVPVVFKGAQGLQGNAGSRSVTVSAFKWSATAVSAPSLAFNYTWSSGTVDAFPTSTGWTSSAPAAVNGQSLYQLQVVVTDTSGISSATAANWSDATVNTIGFRSDGTVGATGDSHRTAYIVTTSATLPTVTGVSGNSAPTGWSFTAPSTALTAGQYLYQVDGTYTAGGNIAWNNPYLSNLKVGSLSALAVDTGALTIGDTGSIRNSGNTGYGAAGIFLGYDIDKYKFSIGDGTNNLTWNGITLSVPAAKITGTLTAGQIAAGAITTDKLLITGNGATLNPDPGFSDSAAWVAYSGTFPTFTTVTDGKVGNRVIRGTGSGSGNWVNVATASRVPIDPNKTYKVRVWARKASGTAGSFYAGLALFDSSGTNISGDGSQWSYAAASNLDIGTTWQKYQATYGAGGIAFPTNARFMSPLVILDYTGDAIHEVQDLRLEEAIGNDLIADGAITADKLSADTVLANKQITIGSSGKIISSGASYGSSGIFLGWDTSNSTSAYKFSIGSGLKYDGTTLTVPAITISADGILSGGGGGQVTRQPIIDGGGAIDSTTFGARHHNDLPSEYPVGRTMQFKYMSAIGLASTGNGWCTLETNKGYSDNNGVNTVQYAYDSTGKTYKRQAPPESTSWPNAWTYDLDRNIYTGDLDATLGATSGVNLKDSNGRTISDVRLLGNLIDSTTWVLGSSGSQTGFNENGTSTGGGNFIVTDSLPDGSLGTIWRARSGSDTAGSTNPEGGWNGTTFNIDHTKTYRFTVWVRPFGGNSSGNVYFGCYANTVKNITENTVNDNPYFVYHARNLMQDSNWSLLVGYVYASNYSGSQLNKSGIYSGTTGAKIIDGLDYKWVSGITNTVLRTYQYYTTAANNYQDFWNPRVDLVDGTEPSLDALLAKSAISARNPLTSANKATYGYTGDLNATYGAILGANVTGKITSANATTLIDNDAISSNLIAANAITTGKLLVTGRGKAINDDPTFMDASAWVTLGDLSGTTTRQVVTETSTPVGTKVMRVSGSHSFLSRSFGIKPSTRYKVSCWIRRIGTLSGSTYMRLNRHEGDTNVVGPLQEAVMATSPYTGQFEGFDPDTGWQHYIGYADTASTVKVGQLCIYTNWGPQNTSGVTEFADFRVEEYIGGDLIVDGAITASKISTINLSVVNSAARGGRNADAVGITLDAPNNAGGTSAGGRIVIRDGSNNIRVKIGYLL